VVSRSPVSFDTETEKLKISGNSEVYAPDGTRLITGSDVGAYAGQKLTVRDSGDEFEIAVPERRKIADRVIDYGWEGILFFEEFGEKDAQIKTGNSTEFVDLDGRISSHLTEEDGIVRTCVRIIPGETFTFRMKATDKLFASEELVVKVPEAPDFPEKMPAYTIKDGEPVFEDDTIRCIFIPEDEKQPIESYLEYYKYENDREGFVKLMSDRYGVDNEEDLSTILWAFNLINPTDVSKTQYIIMKKATESEFASKAKLLTLLLKRDADKNGVVDGRDATLVLTHYAKISAGGEGVLDEDIIPYCDMDSNDIIDGRDATEILTYYAKSSVIN